MRVLKRMKQARRFVYRFFNVSLNRTIVGPLNTSFSYDSYWTACFFIENAARYIYIYDWMVAPNSSRPVDNRFFPKTNTINTHNIITRLRPFTKLFSSDNVKTFCSDVYGRWFLF